MATNTGITRQQREALGLLSVGTFLEYFDLMLYIHMAVLLNDLFFPQTDPLTKQILAATTFSITYLLRPLGGFVIGRIGDLYGRKSTIMITTLMMAASCLVMANLKTYAEIGITASITIMLCRMLQGFSSLGEAIGAKIYLTEILKTPNRYVASGIIGISGQVGGMFALLVSSLVLLTDLNWRLAFWVGAIIAVIGVFARIRLRETPQFADYKRRIKDKLSHSGLNNEKSRSVANSSLSDEKFDKKNNIRLFFDSV